MDPTCSRCGRARGEDEVVGIGIPIEILSDDIRADGRLLREGTGWNQVAGELVCPECVTVDEERDVVMSFITMVEAEVVRQQSLSADPLPYQTPLIT
ncbi:MAG: hypothetical protein ABIP57_07525, partial [Jatrophihabitantaceae bacterium]